MQSENDYQIERKESYVFEKETETETEKVSNDYGNKSENNFSSEKEERKQYKQYSINAEKEFTDPSKLFDFVISNSKLRTILINEIKSILKIMNDILFTPPYPILFGRVSIAKPKEKVKSKQIPIDKSFYEGFGIL